MIPMIHRLTGQSIGSIGGGETIDSIGSGGSSVTHTYAKAHAITGFSDWHATYRLYIRTILLGLQLLSRKFKVQSFTITYFSRLDI